ncbi:unnamed protein product [Albugo candida]|uniref:Uncharacterized protein n=1 Tax=Albugo candida TaxID=65357 RepID=A0A024GPF8_9STRA|nr:unnamed protein product [Albugo candida]|eukprot:CCI48772.1 unnamed protein product [Albugo candida]
MRYISLLCCYLVAQSHSFDSVVYFRKQRQGSIWSKDSRCSRKERLENLAATTNQCERFNTTKLEGTDQAARFISLSLHRNFHELYWSDYRSIKRATIDGRNIQTVVGVIANVRFYGSHLCQEDIQMITIRDVPCVSITKRNDTFVECLASLPFSQNEWHQLTGNDCALVTTRGKIEGVVENAEDMERIDPSLPLIKSISLSLKPVLPHSIAFDDSEDTTLSDDSNWLYWSNSADGKLYRTHIRTNALEEIANNVWAVRGIVIARRWNAIFFTLENKGKVMYKTLDSLDPSTPANVLIDNLKSPRGLAIDKTQDNMFFTEKTGRVYQVNLYMKNAKLRGYTRKVISLPSITRLNAIAVSVGYLYWVETNSNLIVRASLDTLIRQVFIGSRDHANSKRISWPRSVVIVQDEIEGDVVYFSEYIGRISKFSMDQEVEVIIDELANNALRVLDLSLQYDSIASTGVLHFFALE